MIEHVTADEVRDAIDSHAGLKDCRLCVVALQAAWTIEALQARVAELEGKFGDALLDAAYAEGRLDVAKQQIDELEARPPSSPDTDDARRMAAHWEHATPKLIVEGLCDALDASRAECERLRAALEKRGKELLAEMQARTALKADIGRRITKDAAAAPAIECAANLLREEGYNDEADELEALL